MSVISYLFSLTKWSVHQHDSQRPLVQTSKPSTTLPSAIAAVLLICTPKAYFRYETPLSKSSSQHWVDDLDSCLQVDLYSVLRSPNVPTQHSATASKQRYPCLKYQKVLSTGSNLEALYSRTFLHVNFFPFEVRPWQGIDLGQNAMLRFRAALIRGHLLLDNLSVDRDKSPPPIYPLIPASVPCRLLHLEACSFITCIPLILSFLSRPSRAPGPQHDVPADWPTGGPSRSSCLFRPLLVPVIFLRTVLLPLVPPHCL